MHFQYALRRVLKCAQIAMLRMENILLNFIFIWTWTKDLLSGIKSA